MQRIHGVFIIYSIYIIKERVVYNGIFGLVYMVYIVYLATLSKITQKALA